MPKVWWVWFFFHKTFYYIYKSMCFSFVCLKTAQPHIDELWQLFLKNASSQGPNHLLVFPWNQFHENFREYDFTEILISRQDINKRLLYFKSSWWCLWNWNISLKEFIISLKEFIKCSIWKRSALKWNNWLGPKFGEAGPHLINFKTENKQDDTGRTELESLGWPMPSHLFGLYIK